MPTDYARFRGRCKEFSERAIQENPSLTLVRGHYLCPIWGKQPHWWTVRTDGVVHDPTARQFPSKGLGEYVPFDGMVECAECGKQMLEEEAHIQSNYCFCSGECYGRFVGVV